MGEIEFRLLHKDFLHGFLNLWVESWMVVLPMIEVHYRATVN